MMFKGLLKWNELYYMVPIVITGMDFSQLKGQRLQEESTYSAGHEKLGGCS